MKKLFLFLALMSFLSIYSFAQKDEKLTVNQVIEKHLAAIGTPEKRALNRIVVGDTVCNTTLLSSQAGFNGKTAITSDNSNFLFLMRFRATFYPKEEVAFDGKEITRGEAEILLGQTSQSKVIAPLTLFSKEFEEIFSHSLIGGTLSANWVLQSALSSSKAKVEVSEKKVDGKESYILKYIPKDKGYSSDVSSIRIFIDKSNFQHFRTEYKKSYPQRGGLDQINVNVEKYLTEDFSDFKTVNGLTLPHKYTVRLEYSQVRTKWETIFNNFMFDQKLDAKMFNIKKIS